MRVLQDNDLRWVAGGHYDTLLGGEDWCGLDEYGNPVTVLEPITVYGHSWLETFLDKALGWAGDVLGFDGDLGYNGPEDRTWFWDHWDEAAEAALDNAAEWFDNMKDAVSDWRLSGYDPSGGATETTDQTNSHLRGAEESEAMDKARFAANLADAVADGSGPWLGGPTPPEKIVIWMDTHPGWNNQDAQYIPQLSDFGPGGLLENNYDADAPYSINRTP